MSRLYAVIDPASPRYAGWCRDLGCDYLPVESARVEPVDYGDGAPPSPSYRVDITALSAGQLHAIIRETARAEGVTFDEALVGFVEFGMFVNVAEVLVCEDPAAGRLRFPFWSRLRAFEGGGGPP